MARKKLSRLQRVLRAAEYRYPSPSAEEIEANFPARVRLLYRGEDGSPRRKILEWKRPVTAEALSAWMDAYLERVRNGYIPEGFDRAPIPHCARIYRIPSNVLAIWPPNYKPPKYPDD